MRSCERAPLTTFGMRCTDSLRVCYFSSFTIETRGNVLAATAFLQSLAAEDLRRDELDDDGPDYQVSMLVRAAKGCR